MVVTRQAVDSAVKLSSIWRGLLLMEQIIRTALWTFVAIFTKRLDDNLLFDTPREQGRCGDVQPRELSAFLGNA
jgi:hypothetical protein